MDNPFVYSRPVPPADLIDREPETAKLLELLRGGHNCRLSAPRRYGKTSLLQRLGVAADLEGLPTVYVNFYGLLSLEEAVERLDRGYRELRGPLVRWVAGRLQSLALSTPLGTASATAGRHGAEQRLHELLDLPSQLFARSGARVLVCFDEFQETLSTRTPLDGAIRSAIERHGDQASYVFAGSHPGMMRALFEARERPFYGQARPLRLAPLAAEDIAPYLGDAFEAGGRDIGTALRSLLTIARGHPQRVMMLAHHLWERTPRGATADEATFAEALLAAMEELSEAFDRTWRGLGDAERRALVAIVTSDGRPTSAAALNRADIPRTTLVEALGRLTDAGLIDDDGAIVDPLLARWLVVGRADA